MHNQFIKGITTMKMKSLVTVATVLAISLSATAGFSAYKVYTDNNMNSKVITEIDSKNAGDFIKIGHNKNGDWQKYANVQNGNVGWVNIKDIKKHRTEVLRQKMLNNIDNNISYYEDQLKELTALKKQVSLSDLKQLYQLQNPYHVVEYNFSI